MQEAIFWKGRECFTYPPQWPQIRHKNQKTSSRTPWFTLTFHEDISTMVTQKDDVQFRRKRELLDPLSQYTLRLAIQSMCEMGSETTVTLDFPLFQCGGSTFISLSNRQNNDLPIEYLPCICHITPLTVNSLHHNLLLDVCTFRQLNQAYSPLHTLIPKLDCCSTYFSLLYLQYTFVDY